MKTDCLPDRACASEKAVYTPPVVRRLGNIVEKTLGATCGTSDGGAYICVVMNNLPGSSL
jgi:hypothetical protein